MLLDDGPAVVGVGLADAVAVEVELVEHALVELIGVAHGRVAGGQEDPHPARARVGVDEEGLDEQGQRHRQDRPQRTGDGGPEQQAQEGRRRVEPHRVPGELGLDEGLDDEVGRRVGQHHPQRRPGAGVHQPQDRRRHHAQDEADIRDVVGDEGDHAPGDGHRHVQVPQGDRVDDGHDETEDRRDHPVGAHRLTEGHQGGGHARLEDSEGRGADLDLGGVEHEEDDHHRHDAHHRAGRGQLPQDRLRHHDELGGVQDVGDLLEHRGLVDPHAVELGLDLLPDRLELGGVLRQGVDELGDGDGQGREEQNDEGEDERDRRRRRDHARHPVARHPGHQRPDRHHEGEGEEGRGEEVLDEVEPHRANGQCRQEIGDGLPLRALPGEGNGGLPSFFRHSCHGRILPRTGGALRPDGPVRAVGALPLSTVAATAR